MTDDFSNHPKSVTELRSDRSEKASDWTPRDVLINLLRDIDSGELETPTAIFVVLELPSDEPGLSKVRIRNSTKSPIHSLGMIEIGKSLLLE